MVKYLFLFSIVFFTSPSFAMNNAQITLLLKGSVYAECLTFRKEIENKMGKSEFLSSNALVSCGKNLEDLMKDLRYRFKSYGVLFDSIKIPALEQKTFRELRNFIRRTQTGSLPL